MDVFDQFDQLNDTQKSKQTKLDDKEDVCPHANVIINMGFHECADCGLQLTENKKEMVDDYTRCWIVKKAPKGLFDDVKHCGFPEAVVSKANEIFEKACTEALFRINRRRIIVIACLIEAYKLLKIPYNIRDITDHLPTNSANPLAGSEIIEPIVKQMDINRERDIYISPLYSIREILSSNWQNWESVYPEIKEIFEKVDQKTIILSTARHKSVAAGVIYYYILMRSTPMTLDQFAKISKMSSATIKKMVLDVAKVLNTSHLVAAKLK